MPKPWLLEIAAFYIVDGCKRANVYVSAEAHAVVRPYLGIQVFVFGVVIVVAAFVIANAPESCRY